MRADILKDYINGQCEGVPAWKIIAVTAGTTCSVIWLHSVVFDPEISNDPEVKLLSHMNPVFLNL